MNRFIFCACFFSSLIIQTSNAANIAIVESYHKEYEWDAAYIRAIKSTLGNNHTYKVYALDSKHQPEEVWQKTAKEIADKLQSSHPDIVLMGDDNAMKSVGSVLNGGDIPVVFLGVNGTLLQYGIIDSPNITGVLERPFFKRSVRHLCRLLNNCNRVLVLMDGSVTMQNAVGNLFGSENNVTLYRTDLDLVLTNSANEWRSAVDSAEESYDAIILGTYHTIQDTNGNYFEPDDAMKYARSNTSLPIFSFWDFSVGTDKAIGGYTITAYEEGRAAARMAQLILGGVRVSSLPQIESGSGQYVYSETELKKYGITPSVLIRTQAVFVE